MPLTRRKRYPNTVDRRKVSAIGSSSRLARRTPIEITGATPGDTTVVTFDQAVILSGIPQWPNNSGHVPTAAVLTGPAEVTLTYPTPDTTTSFVVPFEDPAVRNGAGGYVQPGTFPA